MKIITFLLIIAVLIAISCDNSDYSKINSYLKQWTGKYEGTSHHWSSYPAQINGQWQWITDESYNKVLIEVVNSELDSCLNFKIKYNDTILDIKENLLFSKSGFHYSEWGGGSGYGSLSISFKSDTMFYKYFQKCGIPCSSGIDFNILKK